MEQHDDVPSDGVAQFKLPRLAYARGFAALLEACGGALVLTLALVDVADVAAHIAVAVVFSLSGENVWFGLVMTSLCWTHAVYALTGAELVCELRSWERWARVPRLLRWLAALVFARLVPIINVYLDTHNSDARLHDGGYSVDVAVESSQGSVTVSSYDVAAWGGIDTAGVSRAAAEELEHAAPTRAFQQRVLAALVNYPSRFGLFYIELFGEALPLSIVLLVYIVTQSPAPSLVQVSLGISLFSIATKLVAAAQSYDVRVAIFKYGLAVHDIFSTFFLVSTILGGQPQQTTFFGFPITWLGLIWLWKFTLSVGGIAVHGAVFLAYAISRADYRVQDKLAAIFSALGWFVSILPLFVVLEYVKTTIILVVFAAHDPTPSVWPALVALISFVSRDDVEHSRLRFCVRRLIDAEEIRANASAGPSDPTPLAAPLIAARQRALDTASRFDVEVLRGILGTPLTHVLSKVNYGSGWRRTALLSWITIGLGALVLGQAYSAVYPFVYTGMFGFSSLTLFERICFITLVVAAGSAVLASPSAWRAYRWNVSVAPLIRDSSLRAVLKIFDEYHHPAYVGTLQQHVDSSVLPAVLIALVSEYLAPADVGLRRITIEECQDMRDALRRDGLIDRDVDVIHVNSAST